MKYIANILSDEPFEESELYNVVRNYDDLLKNVPTLIVGWEKVKEKYPDALIIEWKVADNVYWTYGKYERRDKYEANVKKFQDLAFKKFVDSLDYVFYDVLVTDFTRFDSFIASLKSTPNKTIYASGDMLYIYYEGQSKVIGLSLRDCDYIDENYKKRIFSAIHNSETITLLKNNDAISKEVRFKSRGRTYILPYLYS